MKLKVMGYCPECEEEIYSEIDIENNTVSVDDLSKLRFECRRCYSVSYTNVIGLEYSYTDEQQAREDEFLESIGDM